MAEAAKLLENVYRAVNIALVNEMKVILSAMGIDVWEVIAAAATKPFGYQPFYPGPGLGGHCIPIDPFYLTWKAREVGRTTRFIELAGEINHAMPGYVVERTMLALNDRGRAVKGSRLLVLGLAYKPDVDDVRESPSFELIERLTDLGAAVDYNDPHVPATHPMRKYGDLGLRSVPLSPEALAGYDAVLVATHHAAYDWQQVADHARLDRRHPQRPPPRDRPAGPHRHGLTGRVRQPAPKCAATPRQGPTGGAGRNPQSGWWLRVTGPPLGAARGAATPQCRDHAEIRSRQPPKRRI